MLSGWGLRGGSVHRISRRVVETLTLVGFNVGVDVRLGGELGRVARVIDRIRPLIHSNPVDSHSHREGQVFEINKTEVTGHSQVNDEVLWDNVSVRCEEEKVKRSTIGSCGMGLGPISTLSSAANPPARAVHACLLSLIHRMY